MADGRSPPAAIRRMTCTRGRAPMIFVARLIDQTPLSRFAYTALAPSTIPPLAWTYRFGISVFCIRSSPPGGVMRLTASSCPDQQLCFTDESTGELCRTPSISYVSMGIRCRYKDRLFDMTEALPGAASDTERPHYSTRAKLE
jgi:hypothetical protein